jgi:hypothetical protein
VPTSITNLDIEVRQKHDQIKKRKISYQYELTRQACLFLWFFHCYFIWQCSFEKLLRSPMDSRLQQLTGSLELFETLIFLKKMVKVLLLKQSASTTFFFFFFLENFPTSFSLIRHMGFLFGGSNLVNHLFKLNQLGWWQIMSGYHSSRHYNYISTI